MSADTAPSIRLSGFGLAYDGAALFQALDFTASGAGLTAVLGASGVGKSTLLRAVAGLVPAAGAVITAGAVSLMAQDDALLPWADAAANVAIGDRLRGARPDFARARTLLKSVGLADIPGLPATWSGGMRKRVALARLLYEDRPIALLDEPFAALDALTRVTIHALAARLLEGRLALLVTHDPLEALALADRIVVLAGSPARITLDEEPPLRPHAARRDPLDPSHRRLHARILAALGAAP
ncbi:MAG: ATP-binding cassette domain-containing protein [Micropepsaceae bacterium]